MIASVNIADATSAFFLRISKGGCPTGIQRVLCLKQLKQAACRRRPIPRIDDTGGLLRHDPEEIVEVRGRDVLGAHGIAQSALHVQWNNADRFFCPALLAMLYGAMIVSVVTRHSVCLRDRGEQQNTSGAAKMICPPSNVAEFDSIQSPTRVVISPVFHSTRIETSTSPPNAPSARRDSTRLKTSP